MFTLPATAAKNMEGSLFSFEKLSSGSNQAKRLIHRDVAIKVVKLPDDAGATEREKYQDELSAKSVRWAVSLNPGFEIPRTRADTVHLNGWLKM